MAPQFAASKKHLCQVTQLAIGRRVEQLKRFPQTGARYSKLSVGRSRALSKYHDRPAAADMAFCISALSLEMPEDIIMRALEDDYLSRATGSMAVAALTLIHLNGIAGDPYKPSPWR